MCPFYNAQLFEITGAAKGVFTHSQSSCHIAKVVLTIRHDSRQIPIASDARPFHTSRGFLHWRFAYAGPHRARRTTFMGPASANLHRTGHQPFSSKAILWECVTDNLEIGARVSRSNLHNGFCPKLLEIIGENLKKIFAQTVAASERTTLWIAALTLHPRHPRL